jgi:uncharacterized membrane protein
MIWSLILIPILLLQVEGTLRILLGIPFVLFIPGYVLICALYPTREKEGGIDVIERIALSFGLSLAIVPLIGLGLNYTPWGIHLEPILLSLLIFINGVGTIAIYRWIKTSPHERFIISFNLSLPILKNNREKTLTILQAAIIVIALISLAYVMMIPSTGEKYTVFYILGSDGKIESCPKNLTAGENTSVIIGIINHEGTSINYTIEIWLINQTIIYNESINENKTIYNHMWFMDKIRIAIPPVSENNKKTWESQWKYNYTFNISRKGEFKLVFLLFQTQTDYYSYDKDYRDIAGQKIENAYRKTHLMINVN